MLGPIQFIIYINDSQPTASLFAADAKKYKIRTEADYEAMQRDMKKLDDCSNNCHVDKCKTMHINHKTHGAITS